MSRKGTGRGPDLVCGEVGKASLMSASQLRSESWTPTQLRAWGARGARGAQQAPARCAQTLPTQRLPDARPESQPRLGCNEQKK